MIRNFKVNFQLHISIGNDYKYFWIYAYSNAISNSNNDIFIVSSQSVDFHLIFSQYK